MARLLDAVSVLLFSSQARWFSKTFEIEKALRRAAIHQHPLVFSARWMMIFHIVLLSSFAAASASYTATLSPMIAIISYSAASIASILAFAAPLIQVSAGASKRRGEVEFEIPFFAVYSAIMARGGVPISRVFERFSESTLFPAMRREAEMFMVETRVFGRDPITAAENIARNHPSASFSDLLLGYTTITRVGGDISEYLSRRVEDLFRRFEEHIKRVVGRLVSIMEIYIAIVIIGGLSILILIYASGGVAIAKGGGNPIASIFIYLILPSVNAMTIFYIHVSSPKRLQILSRTPVIAVYSAAGSLILLLASSYILGWHRIFYGVVDKNLVIWFMVSAAASIAAICIPTWIYYRWERSEYRAKLGEKIVEFLSDLAENRKVGLSVEKSIEMLSSRDYGVLNNVVKTLAVSIKAGLDLAASARIAISSVRSWFARVIFAFLVDSVVVGGGSSEIVSELAKYAKVLNELESRVVSSLRSQMFIPYIASGALAISIFAIAFMVSQSAAVFSQNIKTPELYSFILINAAGSLINSFMMGLVAGKVSEMSIFAGFKHSLFMSMITASIVSITTVMML